MYYLSFLQKTKIFIIKVGWKLPAHILLLYCTSAILVYCLLGITFDPKNEKQTIMLILRAQVVRLHGIYFLCVFQESTQIFDVLNLLLDVFLSFTSSFICGISALVSRKYEQ